MNFVRSGTSSTTLAWVQIWLTNKTKQVLLENTRSSRSVVKSGVLQGTFLGSLCFLYINDTANDISSNLKLFADDWASWSL